MLACSGLANPVQLISMVELGGKVNADKHSRHMLEEGTTVVEKLFCRWLWALFHP